MADYIYDQSGLVKTALDKFDCESEHAVCPFCGEDNTGKVFKPSRMVTCETCNMPFTVNITYQTAPLVSWHSTDYDPKVKEAYRKKTKE